MFYYRRVSYDRSCLVVNNRLCWAFPAPRALLRTGSTMFLFYFLTFEALSHMLPLVKHSCFKTKQGKSEGFDSCDRPSNLKLDSNRQFFRLCDREIGWMTLQNNRAPLLCYFKLCALFPTHWWIQTWVTVRKRSIRVKIDNFFSCVTYKFYGWPSKAIGHLFYATSSFVHHFVVIGEFKLELQSGNAQFGSNSMNFRAVRPWNLTDDLAKQ